MSIILNIIFHFIITFNRTIVRKNEPLNDIFMIPLNGAIKCTYLYISCNFLISSSISFLNFSGSNTSTLLPMLKTQALTSG